MKKHLMLFSLLLLLFSFRATAQSCGAPTNLVFTYANAVNTFTWDPVPGAIAYIFQFKEPTYGWENAYADTLTTNVLAEPGNGLESSTFEWRVISICSTDRDTSAEVSFTVPCVVPSAPATTNITQTSATFNWVHPPGFNVGFDYYTLAYRPLGSTTWIALPQLSNNTYTKTNLLSNTNYEWCVNRLCAYFNSPPVISQFTTLAPSCPAPAVLNVLNLTNTSARLNWSFTNGAAYYTVQYRLLGSPTWTTIQTTNSNTQYVLTGLTLNTSYEYRVAANCNSSSQSPFSTPFVFTTNCVSLNNTAEWIDFVRIGSLLRTSGAEPNGYMYGLTNLTLVAGTTYQMRVSAGFSGPIQQQDYAAYLDANKNGIFEMSEQVSGMGLIKNGSTYTFNLTVPANAQTGTISMRVIMLRKNQPGVSFAPCVPAGTFGEMEDYGVNIIAPSQAQSGDVPGESKALERSADESMAVAQTLVYPNPNQGMFIIESGAPLTQYSVFQQNGAEIISETFANEVKSIQVSDERLTPGLYFVKATDYTGRTTCHKVLVN